MMELPNVLPSERLLLRRARSRDVPVLTDLRQRLEVREFLGGALKPEVARAKALASVNSPEHLVVVRRSDGLVVGLVSLMARGSEVELSYEFLPEAWGEGFASEACEAVLNLHASASGRQGGVVAVTQGANDRSRRLLERLGMVPRERFVEHGAPQVLYATPPSD